MIGERLSEVRKDHGETQAQLAAALGVSLSAVRAWEQEKNAPPHELLVTLCRRYGVSADYLLGLSDVDPAYFRRRQLERLDADDLGALREFEEFLCWRRRRSRLEEDAVRDAERCIGKEPVHAT